MAAREKSDASVSTSKGKSSAIAPKQALAKSSFNLWKEFKASPSMGKVEACSERLAFSENLEIHFEQYENMPDTRLSSLAVDGGERSS